MKKVSFGNKQQPVTPDAWVNAGPKDPDTLDADEKGSQAGEPEPMKRLTIDVSQDLHTAIKTTCARRRVKMADEIRDLLTRHFMESRES
jgi:hypothetical protein